MRSRTLREGSVGLLILVFLVILGGLVMWLRGMRLGDRGYEIIVKFANADSLKVGAPVRYRGVKIGKTKKIEPSIDGVKVTLAIDSSDLRIPQDVAVETSQTGLVGETSIDIIPRTSLPSNALSLQPDSADCSSQIIVCDQDEIVGETGASFQQLVRATLELTEKFNNSQLFNNLDNAARNTSVAANEVAQLSQELTKLSQSVQKELAGTSQATDSITKLADSTSTQITTTGEQINDTVVEFNQLLSSVNNLVAENRGTLVATLTNISDTSAELRNLLVSLAPAVDKVNSTLATTNTQQLLDNLEALTDNATVATANLRHLSENLNSPTNVLLLQKTLDSARATFENAQKITADLDELTGNPAFRTNLLRLVNGLSNLVSSTEQLDQLVQTAEILPPTQTTINNLESSFSFSLNSTSLEALRQSTAPANEQKETTVPFAAKQEKRRKKFSP